MEGIHPIWLMVLAGLASLIPLIIGLGTSYLKVSIVLAMLRSGLGAQQVPSAMVTMALSLALTLQVMGPVLRESGEIIATVDFSELRENPGLESLKSVAVVLTPWQDFLEQHAGAKELAVLTNLQLEASSKSSGAKEPQDTALFNTALIPAFVLTELKQAFAMGFVLLLPFLVIDLIVANVLVGMGMFMVSPVMISLPLKLMFFVAADGWLLLSQSLLRSYLRAR